MVDADVVLLPSFSRVEGYRKRVADRRRAGVFSQTVTTFDAWIADLWELHGDGRTFVDSATRDVLLRTAFGERCGQHGAGWAGLAADCLREAAGVEAFEDAVAAVRGGGTCEGLSARECEFLAGIAAYEEGLEELGLVEAGQAACALASESHRVFPRALLVQLVDEAPLTQVQELFFSSCPQISLASAPGQAARVVHAAPTGVKVRFGFSAGKASQPALLADIVRECAGQGEVVVACKDPLGLFGHLAPDLSQCGVKVRVQARKPFSRTDFGRAFLAQYHNVHGQPWSKAYTTDVMLTPYSGATYAEACRVDASLRADRIVQRDDVLAELGALYEPFSQLLEIADDPQADILLGAFEQMAQSQAHRTAAWRSEQLAAMGAMRDVTAAARRVGADIGTCADLLENASVSVCAATDVAGPVVTFMSQAAAAQLDAGACATLVVSDLTSQDYPVADRDDAARTLFAKLGITPVDSAIDQARRQFNRLLELPSAQLVLVRPLADFDAEETYPCVVLEEFVDAYRSDPSRTDDIDNAYRVPEELLAGMVERGDELLFANARGLGADSAQPICDASQLPPFDEVGDLDPALIVPRRRNSEGQLLDRACPSPSQIETYLECPFLWFVQRRLSTQSLDEGFGPLEKGTFAHAALEEFYRRYQSGGKAKVQVADLDEARSLMRELLDEMAALQPSADPGSGRLVAANELERREVEALKSQLVSYLDVEARLLPTYRPTYFEYEIDADHPVEYGGNLLVGKVDRIDVDDAGHAVIIDYKGSVGPRHQIGRATPSDPGKVQTRIYAQAIKRALGLDVVGALYVSYGKNAEVAGAFDPRVVEAAHLPNMRHDVCSCGLGLEVPSDPPPDFQIADLAFDVMLDETERAAARAAAGMAAGNISPSPVDSSVCRYCPVLTCPKRGA